ncbi:DUF502 domain-containing protein [Consotaella salsifontis]|uniref:Uncharacterized membrane protein n=1 Tax=Consotaella salsifontis TaxID=1365950 RepID=A0A1T4TBI2_9HYPH|nr:DUF502 domain-containing protein [Consotaella salsifontis]SKA37834.1 Uncharacterized membrane protein [Consotaella salsifontis]
MMRLRNYFLTGFVILAPLAITLWLTWSFVQWVDGWVTPYIPGRYNPNTYLPFPLPGFGLLVALVMITLVGFLAANLIGRTILNWGERLLGRMPLVRTIYTSLKQIFETVLSDRSSSFQMAGLIEYPRPGLWSLVFIATNARGEIASIFAEDGIEAYAVFLPTTPNPTSGYLLYVPKTDVKVLTMSIEEAAKLIISAGLVTADRDQAPTTQIAAAREVETRPATPKTVAETVE